MSKNSKADEKGNTKGLLKGTDQMMVTFEVEPPMVIPVQQPDQESNSSSGEAEDMPFIPGRIEPQEKAHWIICGDGNKE